MSHYACLVILPKRTPLDERSIRAAIAVLMEPYSENLDCPVRLEDCWLCKGTGKVGSGDFPDGDCHACGGKKQTETVRNPEGRWDWYQIGGRWTGHFDGYDPAKDPDNMETCEICNGRGSLLDRSGKLVACNGCSVKAAGDGKGRALKWPTQWGFRMGDTILTSELADRKLEEISTYAVLAPDGKWTEKKTWDGEDFVENPEAGWFREALEGWGKHTAVIVDYHS